MDGVPYYRRRLCRHRLAVFMTMETMGEDWVAGPPEEYDCDLALYKAPHEVLVFAYTAYGKDIIDQLCSGHALESEREQAIATGCDEFDAKPIEFDSLVATIRRMNRSPLEQGPTNDRASTRLY